MKVLNHWNISIVIILSCLSLPGFTQVIKEARFPQGKFASDNSGDEFMSTYVGPITSSALSLQGNGWVPSGVMANPISKKCLTNALDLRLKEWTASRDFAAELREYFEDCGAELVYQHNKGLMGLYEFLKVSYPFQQLANIKNIQFLFEDGTLLEGVIGIQDNKPRPWVILKCGVFCAAGDGFTTRNFLISLFDQAPFNVIFLGNRTGLDYIKNNRNLTAGGYHESHDFFEVARWLREKSTWASPNLEVHGVGVSLGGSAALYTAELESIYRSQSVLEGEKKGLVASPLSSPVFFNSISAICPVADLHTTLDRMFTSTFKGALIGHFAWGKIKDAIPYLDLSKGVLSTDQRPPNRELGEKLGLVASRYGELWGKSPYYKRSLPSIRNIQEQWTFNDFIRYSPHKNVTPTLIWASKDDGIVATDVNTGALENSKDIQSNENIGVVTVDFGDHCGLATSYGYPTVSSVLRNFILSHSPIYQSQRTQRGPAVRTQKYDFNFTNIDLNKATLLRHWWRVEPKDKMAHLVFEFFDQNKNRHCPFSDATDENTKELCRHYLEAKIPLADLTTYTGIPQEIESNGEAHHWMRRLNYLARVTHNGETVEWTSLQPNQIEFQQE